MSFLQHQFGSRPAIFASFATRPLWAKIQWLGCVVVLVASSFTSAYLGPAHADELSDAGSSRASTQLSNEMEDIKEELLGLRRDLVILEEDLLFPASSQVAVFVSMDVGELFQLDAVTLKINNKSVTHHLYTEKQVEALYRGGVQKLYVGNVKQGKNTVTAFFTGLGPSGRDYRRASTVTFEKTFEPAFVELQVLDSQAKIQPKFNATAGQ